jgi:hypothetical protein
MLGMWEVFLAASAPIVKVMIVAMVGAASATERAGILTQEGLKSLSRIIIYILVPAFLFTKLAGTLTVEKLGMWWLIVAFVLLNNMCGMSLGYIIVTMLPTQVGKHRRLVLAACTLGNVGQIPLALASAACTEGLDKFASRTQVGDCDSDAQAMVGFGIRSLSCLSPPPPSHILPPHVWSCWLWSHFSLNPPQFKPTSGPTSF